MGPLNPGLPNPLATGTTVPILIFSGHRPPLVSSICSYQVDELTAKMCEQEDMINYQERMINQCKSEGTNRVLNRNLKSYATVSLQYRFYLFDTFDFDFLMLFAGDTAGTIFI